MLTSAFAGLMSIAAGVVVLPIVLSTVGSTSYGLWLFIFAVVSICAYADLGVGISVVHYRARERGGDHSIAKDRVLGTALLWSLIGAVLALGPLGIAAWAFARTLPDDAQPTVFTLALIGAGIVLTSAALRPFQAALIGDGYVHLERSTVVAGVVWRIAATVAVCLFVPSVILLALVESIALVLPLAIAMIQLARNSAASVSLVGWRKQLPELLRFGSRSFSVSLLGQLILQSGTLALGILSTPENVTYYNAAFRIYSSVRQTLSWVTDPLRSMLSRAAVAGRAHAAELAVTLSTLSALIAAVGSGLVFLLSPWIVDVWLGQGVPSETISLAIRVLSVGLIASALHISFIPALDAVGKPGAFWPVQTAWLVLQAAALSVLVPIQPVVGAAIALSAPAILLEVAFVAIALHALSIRARDWTRATLVPTAVVVGITALCFALELGLSAAGLPGTTGSVVGSTAFALIVLILMAFFRRSGAVRRVIDATKRET